MVEAGERLLASQCCPTLPNVLAEMAKAGVKRSEATINRNSDALDEVRGEWEARHGRVPQWHRAADESEEDAIVELGQCDCDDDEVGLVRKQLARARRELAQARETIDGLRADNALLSEQVRRLELGPRGEC
jgi:hypothetical protein